MRKFWLISLIILFVCIEGKSQSIAESSRAQNITSPIIVKPGYSYTSDYIPGARMKRVGSKLILAGGFLIIGGAIVLGSAAQSQSTNTYGGNSTKSESGKIMLGNVLIVSGIGCVVPGIVLASVGARKYNQYQRQQEVSLNLNATGVSLRLKF